MKKININKILSNSLPPQYEDVDFFLLNLDYHAFKYSGPQKSNTSTSLQNNCDFLSSLLDSLYKNTKAAVLVQNIAPPTLNIFGSYERVFSHSILNQVMELNQKIEILIKDKGILIDISGLSSNVGLSNWHDQKLWHLAKIPFAQKFNAIYAEFISRAINAKLGKSRRCLILDLDNTLWGGRNW